MHPFFLIAGVVVEPGLKALLKRSCNTPDELDDVGPLNPSGSGSVDAPVTLDGDASATPRDAAEPADAPVSLDGVDSAILDAASLSRSGDSNPYTLDADALMR